MIKNKKILVTGGLGFIGSHLVDYLLKKNHENIVVFDKLKPNEKEKNKRVTYVVGNVISEENVKKLFHDHGPFEVAYHLAAAMPNKEVSDPVMRETNVSGTRNLITEAVRQRTKSFVFISSNVTYGIPVELPVTENTPLKPLEEYGRSKAMAEKELEKFKGKIDIQIFRCPVVTGVGRLGLQAVLYDFISENKKVYVLGGGENKYQFVDVDDVVQALVKASKMEGFDSYVIGADEVLSLKDLYKGVIKFAGSTSKIVPLPMKPALFALYLMDKINYSPLGVYQYTMMGRTIFADTKKIKEKLNWKPVKTNLDTFIENYKWYLNNKGSFTTIGGDNSPNKSIPKMGILNIIKKFS